MNSVRVVADSGCDLSPDLVARYEITVVPCFIQFGRDTVSDKDMSIEEFWQRARTLPQAPGTSAPPPSMFYQAFQRLVAAGHDVLCVTLTSKHSAIHNSACIAAQEFGQRVRVVDSGSFTLGLGFQVIEAARQAMAGYGLDSIQRAVENMRERTSVIFVLDTVEWVRRGGRLARIMPLVERLARTFHVKPVVEMADGDMRLLGVTRSTRAALIRLEEEVRARVPVELIAAAYTRGREVAVELVDRLTTVVGLPSGEILLQEAGPVFATHAGPNALGAIVVRAADPAQSGARHS